jgi:hypothetical protein
MIVEVLISGIGLIALGIFVRFKGNNNPITKSNFLIGGGCVILIFWLKDFLNHLK